jgi:hypothetical protein
MGPQASKSYPGRRLVRPAGPKAERARQEIDYGRRGTAGYVFGALRPATGAALALTFERRTTANWVDFLGAVERWIDPAVERVYAVLDNLNIHSAPDVLLFGLLHPRWEFVFQPKYAAYRVSRTHRQRRRCGAVREMREGPSASAIRSWRQTAASCGRQERPW